MQGKDNESVLRFPVLGVVILVIFVCRSVVERCDRLRPPASTALRFVMSSISCLSRKGRDAKALRTTCMPEEKNPSQPVSNLDGESRTFSSAESLKAVF